MSAYDLICIHSGVFMSRSVCLYDNMQVGCWGAGGGWGSGGVGGGGAVGGGGGGVGVRVGVVGVRVGVVGGRRYLVVSLLFRAIHKQKFPQFIIFGHHKNQHIVKSWKYAVIYSKYICVNTFRTINESSLIYYILCFDLPNQNARGTPTQIEN